MKEQYSQIETMVMQNNISYHENDDKKMSAAPMKKKIKFLDYLKKTFLQLYSLCLVINI